MRSDPHELLARVAAALAHRATNASGGKDPATADEALTALAALRELRGLLDSWEPTLIEVAREGGASWAGLAPALGVSTRQAAERRYLRLRPRTDGSLTREERVRAARDQRAGDRAVAAWARDNASELRQVAGRASTTDGLSTGGRRRARTLASSLTGDDPADLIAPLADLHGDLAARDADLAAAVDAIGRRVTRVRREVQRRRDAAQS